MNSPVKVWRNQKNIARLLGRKGTIVSWTFIRLPPCDFIDQAPYPVALVEFTDGKRGMCQVVDYEEKHLAFDQKVITIVRRVMHLDSDGVIPYGIKVKPV